jgi:thymidylate kinase
MIIAFEGINGVGKTSVAKAVAAAVNDELVRLPRPGAIRDALVNDASLSKHGKFFLYMADMADFYATKDRDKSYLIDRSFISTMVYQTEEGISEELISKSVEDAGIYIDVCFHFTCDPEVAKARRDADISKDGGNPGGFAERGVDYYKELSYKYTEMVNKYCTTIITIDTTNKTVEETTEEVLSTLNALRLKLG